MTLSQLRDPLLAGTRILLTLLLIVFGLGLVAVVVALVAMPFPIVQGQILDLGLASGVTTWAFTGRLVVMLGLVTLILGMVFALLLCLRRIVDTVGVGDPFVPENARRLRAMAWQMVALTLAIPAFPPVVSWINELLREPGVAENFEFQADGLLLALVLFILARVFRQGTAMRTDLEGTV